MHIKKISHREYETVPPGLEIMVLGIICMIIGSYLAFFYSGLPHSALNPFHASPYLLLGELVIFTGIIILFVGAYKKKCPGQADNKTINDTF